MTDLDTYRVDSNDFERDTGISASRGEGNTLSAKLSDAQIKSNGTVNLIGVQYSVIVGGVTKIRASDSYTHQETVDSQALSIFPQISPSVFR